MRVDVGDPDAVAEFCTQYGWAMGNPRTDRSLTQWQLIAPQLVDQFWRLAERDQGPSFPDWGITDERWMINAAKWHLDNDADFKIQLATDDAILTGIMQPHGILWAVAVDVSSVVRSLVLLRDMVRLALFSRGALSAAQVREQVESRDGIPDHWWWGDIMDMGADALLQKVEREHYLFSNEQLLGCAMRYLDDPRLRNWAFDALANLINEGLSGYGCFLQRHVQPGEAELPRRSVTMHQAVCIALYQELAAPDLAYTRCGNETCNTLFIHRRVASGDNRGWTTGQKYCSPECARAQAQRQYRRRISLVRSLARDGMTAEEIATRVDRDVETVQSWLG